VGCPAGTPFGQALIDLIGIDKRAGLVGDGRQQIPGQIAPGGVDLLWDGALKRVVHADVAIVVVQEGG
jgi:hypothetical protein